MIVVLQYIAPFLLEYKIKWQQGIGVGLQYTGVVHRAQKRQTT